MSLTLVKSSRFVPFAQSSVKRMLILLTRGEEENSKHSRLSSYRFGVCTRGDGRRANHTSSDVKYALRAILALQQVQVEVETRCTGFEGRWYQKTLP